MRGVRATPPVFPSSNCLPFVRPGYFSSKTLTGNVIVTDIKPWPGRTANLDSEPRTLRLALCEETPPITRLPASLRV